MVKPEFKKPEGVHVKQPETSSLFEDVAEQPEQKTVEWLDLPAAPVNTLADYPYDGRTVWLTSDGVGMQTAVWRKTRTLKDGRFMPTAGWYGRYGGPRIPYEPLGYQEFIEPIITGKKKVAS